MKKILVLGGTGAMGTYLVPELVKMGYAVDVVALEGLNQNNPDFAFINANAKDDNWLKEQLKNNYDGIVDFMLYNNAEFSNRYKLLLENTKHYIFFSTYRVYAGEYPIKETSPRLLDVSEDKEFLACAEQEYSLYKAMQENILTDSGYKNYTIVRPAITFSKRRFQLVTLEANTVIYRAVNKLPVFLPKDALSVQTTMSWAGDVAKMLSLLTLNEKAYGEAYTLATSEHNTWEQIAKYYGELIGLEYIPVETDEYIKMHGGSKYARYQLIYDRCFERIVDNSKILQITGMKQSDLTKVRDGLANEIANLPQNAFEPETGINKKMDDYFKSL